MGRGCGPATVASKRWPKDKKVAEADKRCLIRSARANEHNTVDRAGRAHLPAP